ncbi:MAG: B12-binding domain-containing radical SAM protein [Candidatus Yonathbacteria bacterium]|nr:B12-binding domain-containing radical SAM protein [Candidatus Yonathbacteria bacterium]
MKIVLVRCNWTTRRMILPPLGLGYVSAAVKRAGHDCVIRDSWLLNESPLESANRILREHDNIAIIGVQVYQNTIEWTREFFHWLRHRTDARLIIGGPIPTALGEEARLATRADCAVQGEFETDIAEHLDAIMNGATLIEWKSWLDVNEHPYPDWDAMPLPPYWPYIYSAGAPVRGKRVGFIQRMRGCPNNCTFCASGGIIMGKKVRLRNLSNVMKELEFLLSRWNIDELWFQDDDVTIKYDDAINLFRALVPYKLHVRLQMGIRTDHLTDDMIYWMKKAGVYYAGIGIESGVPRVLTQIKKGLHQQKVIQGIEKLDKAGIQVMGFFMFGLPTETTTDMDQTIQWALKTKLHHAQFAVYIPYPGSEDYRNNYQPTIPQAELMEIQKRATMRFYLRPRIILSILRHIKWSQVKAIIHHDWVWRGLLGGTEKIMKHRFLRKWVTGK